MEWFLFGIAIIVRLLIIWWCVSTARKKNRDTVLAGMLGFFFGLWAAIGYAIVKSKYYNCPKCDGPTELKKVIKGKDTGKSFYVCCAYPYCTGRVKA